MKHTLTTLENKLRVLTIDTESFPTATALLLVGAGSRYEHAKNNGIAHFFEHMAFKGSEKYPNSYAISSAIEGMGGLFNAFTSKDHTGYWIKATNEHLPLVIEVLGDMILRSKLEPEEIEREKGVIIEEIHMYEDMPARKIGDLFEGMLYEGNPLGYDIAGTPETVSSFSRDTFTNYMHELYHPSNALLVVAGGLHDIQKDIVSLATTHFGTWKPRSLRKPQTYKVSQTKPQLRMFEKKTEQLHMCIGYRTFSFQDTRKATLQVLAAILGGGMSSRLFMQVRERRGLCYYISTGRELYADTGSIVTQAGIANDQQKINEAIRVIIEEHEAVAAGKISDTELKNAKELIKGRILLSMEDSMHVASTMGTKLLLEGEVLSVPDIVGAVEKVSKDQVVSLAKELFIPRNLNCGVIGPRLEITL